MQGKIVIRSIRKGSVQWNEEDWQKLGALLLTCGYTVRIGRQAVPGTGSGKRKPTMEYVIEAWEESDEEEKLQKD